MSERRSNIRSLGKKVGAAPPPSGVRTEPSNIRSRHDKQAKKVKRVETPDARTTPSNIHPRRQKAQMARAESPQRTAPSNIRLRRATKHTPSGVGRPSNIRPRVGKASMASAKQAALLDPNYGRPPVL